jgi:hypothetical protein
MAQREVPQDAASDERHSGEQVAAARPLAGPKTRIGIGRRLVVPLAIALVPLFWVIDATSRASVTTIGRDQGIFQYIAWAVMRGDIDYRDVRDVNGPLVHMIHTAFLALGGAEEHRFHVLELAITGVTFAFVGACIPGLVSRGRVSLVERAAWAAAAWVALSAQYHLYIYWNQAQRESFCDWFLLPSLALMLLRPGARTRARIVAIAALSTVTWFGKPSFALFTIVQLGALLFDHRDLGITRRTIVSRFALGAALGAAAPIAYLLVYGDIVAFVRITFVDVPNVYRFMWAKSAQEILGEDGPISVTTVGLAVSALLLALVFLRELPRRVLALALAPPCALAGVLAQHKGFGYHFHPLTATMHAGLLVVVSMLWERFRSAPRRRPLGRYVAVGAAVALALEHAASMKGSPHTRNVNLLARGETPKKRLMREYFDEFKSHDFFPWEMREGARYLAETTSPDARVQMYAMDPYVLFLAKRKSATPYIYAYDLDADAALDGGWSNEPTEGQKWRIGVVRAEHERDMLERLKAHPPEAFVFIDRAPLMTYPDAWEDFRHCCSKAAWWVASNYHLARSFGEVHVWLRDGMPVPDIETGGVPQ